MLWQRLKWRSGGGPDLSYNGVIVLLHRKMFARTCSKAGAFLHTRTIKHMQSNTRPPRRPSNMLQEIAMATKLKNVGGRNADSDLEGKMAAYQANTPQVQLCIVEV